MTSKPVTLLIATHNKGKVSEISALLEGLNCRVIGFNDLPDTPPVVDETGETFAENALLKAEQYHQLTGFLTLADDSGLAVDVLDGRPGVYSARYGGENLTSREQISLLLDELKEVPMEQRKARFVCSIALIGEGVRQMFEGQCEGLITYEPRGDGGFGYDPIFLDTELQRTFAELSPEEKSARSHRALALRPAIAFLSGWLKNPAR